MQFIAAIMTEFVNILIITTSKNIDDVVKDFIAFGCIAEIDNLMLYTVLNINSQDDIDRSKLYYPTSFNERSFGDKILL